MSFILDALKKSEADRQGKSSPGIADVPTAVSPSGAPRWLWIVVALLGINLLVLMVVLLRPTGVGPGMPTVTSAEPAARIAETLPEPAIESAPREASVDERAPEATEAAPDESTDRIETIAEAPVVTNEPRAPAIEEPEPETLLTFNDLRASGSVSLPDLHVDLHVYSDNPGERFVFINMNQYRENATLSEGPRVRRITSEGVILEYVGTTFLLPRE